MPGYKAHIAIGLVSSAIVVNLFQIQLTLENASLLLAIAVIYSLLPDIDIDNSKINDAIEILFLSAALISLLLLVHYEIKEAFWAILISNSVLLATKFMKHRGQFHSIRAALLTSAPLYFFNPSLFIIGVVAFISHLVADREIKF